MSTTDSRQMPTSYVDSQESARRESIAVNERRIVKMRKAMMYYMAKMHEAMAHRRTDEGDCHCDIPITDARRPTHCHLCGRKKKRPSGLIDAAIEKTND